MIVYHKKDIAEILGRPVRTITQWLDSGFIIPDVEDSRGKGKARLFSKTNLIEFAMFDLMSKGMNIAQAEIKYILDHLKGIQTEAFGFWSSYEEISDFYTSDKWGYSFELQYSKDVKYDMEKKILVENNAHLEVIQGEESTQGIASVYFHPQIFHSDQIRKINDSEDLFFKLVDVTCNVFWLGTIRNIALKQYGLKL